MVMAALGAFTPLFAMQQSGGGRPPTATLLVSAALLAGGISMILRRRFAFWIALSAGILVAGTGAAGMIQHREIGLPFVPLVSLVAGLYICFRVALAKSSLVPRRRQLIADEGDKVPDPDDV